MKRTLVALAATAAFASACAPTRPPAQLTDARVAFQQALTHPAASMASGDLFDARQALDDAERAFRDGKSDEAQNLAYIAHRKAITARARAEAARAVEVKRAAVDDFQRFRDMQAAAAREQLERAKEARSTAEAAAEAERQAREATKAKVEAIEGVQARPSDKGLVLTISGGVLFPSGKSELLPSAKERLSEVARALASDERTLLVVGHTDTQGSPESNERLSEARADAVRAFLVGEGIDEDRVRSEGMGEALPVAENTTPAGRANNRRVEIILEASRGSGHTDLPKREEGKKAKSKERAKKRGSEKDEPR